MKQVTKHLILVLLILAIILFAVYYYVSVSRTERQEIFVASGHPEWAPIMWQQQGRIVGAGPDLVTKIFTDLGVKIESKYTGLWDMVQQKAKVGSVDVLVAVYKTAERETYMDYSIPYTTDPIAVVVKKGSDLKYNQWEDLVGKLGVLTVGDSYGQEFDDFAAAKLSTIRANSAIEAVNSLEDGSADYFVYALYSAERMIAKNGLQDKIEILPKYVAEENFYVTISKVSPLAKYLPEINSLIKKYKADGTIDQMILENKELYKEQIMK
ncbi:MAG: transporter substrate-binding domain-containing protein [Patescibacteria group bacterium]|jgi:polar amino acid transport system substrate-binding protein